MKAVLLQPPVVKKQQNITGFRKKNSENGNNFKLDVSLTENPINQVLKTVLNLMNRIPVEEDVSWTVINQLRQNYMSLKEKSQLV